MTSSDGAFLMGWLPQLTLGSGYNLLSCKVLGQALDRNSLKLVSSTFDDSSKASDHFSIEWKLIDSADELRNFLSIDSSLSLGYAQAGEASASVKFVKETQVNLYNVYFAVKVEGVGQLQVVKEWKWSEDAQKLLNTPEFSAKYGQYGVDGVQQGFRFFAIFEINCKSTLDKQEFTSSLGGKIGESGGKKKPEKEKEKEPKPDKGGSNPATETDAKAESDKKPKDSKDKEKEKDDKKEDQTDDSSTIDDLLDSISGTAQVLAGAGYEGELSASFRKVVEHFVQNRTYSFKAYGEGLDIDSINISSIKGLYEFVEKLPAQFKKGGKPLLARLTPFSIAPGVTAIDSLDRRILEEKFALMDQVYSDAKVLIDSANFVLKHLKAFGQDLQTEKQVS